MKNRKWCLNLRNLYHAFLLYINDLCTVCEHKCTISIADDISPLSSGKAWRRYDMETFSALLILCEGNLLVITINLFSTISSKQTLINLNQNTYIFFANEYAVVNCICPSFLLQAPRVKWLRNFRRLRRYHSLVHLYKRHLCAGITVHQIAKHDTPPRLLRTMMNV